MSEFENTFIPPEGCPMHTSCLGYEACLQVRGIGEALESVDSNPRYLLTTYENTNCPAAHDAKLAIKLTIDRLRREHKLPPQP